MANTPPIQPHQPAPTEPSPYIEHPGYGCIDPFRAAYSDPKAQQALDDIDQVQQAIDKEPSDTEMLRLLNGDDDDGAIASVRWLQEALERIDGKDLMHHDRPAADAHRRTMKTALEVLQQIEATAATRVTQSVSDQIAAHSQNNLHLSLLQAALRFKKNTPP